MVVGVGSEDGKGLAIDVGVPEASGLDDGANVRALGLELGLEDPGRAPLGHLGQAVGGKAVVVPDSE